MTAISQRQETFREYLDGLTATGTMTAASRVIGKCRATPGRWIVDSKAASKSIPEAERAASVWWLEYPEGSGDFKWFHLHERACKREMIEDVLVGALVRARDGTTEYAYHMGRRVPCLDYEMAALCDLPPEQCILRDAAGNVVFETITRHPSNELSLAVLGAYTSRFSKKLSVSHAHNHTGQVVHQMASPASIAARQALPAVQVVEPVVEAITEGEFVEQPNVDDQPDADIPSEPAPISRVQSPLRAELERLAREKGIL